MKYLYLSFIFITYLDASDIRALLFHGNCTTCHFETKTVSAPSIILLKQRYLDTFASKKEFISYMSNWVVKPSKDGSLMSDAIDKHGLMPDLGFEITTIREISSYIYDTNFTKENDK